MVVDVKIEMMINRGQRVKKQLVVVMLPRGEGKDRGDCVIFEDLPTLLNRCTSSQ